jgi:hypothetical protein
MILERESKRKALIAEERKAQKKIKALGLDKQSTTSNKDGNSIISSANKLISKNKKSEKRVYSEGLKSNMDKVRTNLAISREVSKFSKGIKNKLYDKKTVAKAVSDDLKHSKLSAKEREKIFLTKAGVKPITAKEAGFTGGGTKYPLRYNSLSSGKPIKNQEAMYEMHQKILKDKSSIRQSTVKMQMEKLQYKIDKLTARSKQFYKEGVGKDIYKSDKGNKAMRNLEKTKNFKQIYSKLQARIKKFKMKKEEYAKEFRYYLDKGHSNDE